ncbi:hypothetical protein [Aegicerativicinus sediminis]|uniref:hypothetical protein n=1 Tax=Aegicerativicinus sediminis TaxID=2893202 RepID=UPI001E2D16E7|nr:hypothetical protein [Aegicerativicinus sediminis]
MGQSNQEITVNKDFIVGYSPTVLTIKVHELYNIQGEPGAQDLDNLSSINNGISISGYGHSKKNFQSDVFKGKKMSWLIAKNDPNGEDEPYQLRLYSVTSKDPDFTFFPENPLYSDSDNEISAKVVKGTVGQIFYYNIQFIISNGDGSNPKLYQIDPQLPLVPK